MIQPHIMIVDTW